MTDSLFEIARLKRIIDRLEERNEYLECAIRDIGIAQNDETPLVPNCLGLSRQQSRVFQTILKLDFASHEALMHAAQEYNGATVHLNTIKVILSNIRVKLRKHNIHIKLKNTHGLGYEMAKADKEFIASLHRIRDLRNFTLINSEVSA